MNHRLSHPRPARKKATSFRLDAELVDAFRTFCRDNAGKPFYLSCVGFVEAAIAAHLATMKHRVEGSEGEIASGNHDTKRPP